MMHQAEAPRAICTARQFLERGVSRGGIGRHRDGSLAGAAGSWEESRVTRAREPRGRRCPEVA